MMEQPLCWGTQWNFEKNANSCCTFTSICACHRLQLSIRAANVVPEGNKMLGTMGNVRNHFYYPPKKAESLKEVQSVLKLLA